MKWVVIWLALASAACSTGGYDSNQATAAALMLGAGMQNYGVARAAYHPVYQNSTYCYPVGRGISCW